MKALSITGKLKDTLEVECNVPNDCWYFDIVPEGGWISKSELLVATFAIKVRNNLAKNNYNLKETFFLRHTYDTDDARKSLLNNDYRHLVCYNETFTSGTASNGMLYISYSFIRSSNAFTNLINQAISTNNDAVMIFDFADMQDGTIDDSTITGFLD